MHISMFVSSLVFCLEIIGTVGSRAISEIHVGRHALKSLTLSLTAFILLPFIVTDFMLTKKD